MRTRTSGGVGGAGVSPAPTQFGKRRHPRSPLNSFLRSPPPVATPDVAAITNDGVRQQTLAQRAMCTREPPRALPCGAALSTQLGGPLLREEACNSAVDGLATSHSPGAAAVFSR